MLCCNEEHIDVLIVYFKARNPDYPHRNAEHVAYVWFARWSTGQPIGWSRSPYVRPLWHTTIQQQRKGLLQL
jgi:hypothetical protein